MAAGRDRLVCGGDSVEENFRGRLDSLILQGGSSLSAKSRRSRLGLAPRTRSPPLLVHAVKMMDGASPATQRMSGGDGGGYVGLGQKSGSGQTAVERKVAGHRCCESATCAMGGIRTLPFGLKDLLFRTV